MPWALTWVRTSTYMNVGNEWFNETPKNRLKWNGTEIGSYDWLNENKWKETYPYLDKYDNTTVNATISVSEGEWRPRGLKWTRLFSMTIRNIKVEFDQEVGNRKGSWKGGAMGCGYDLLEGESPFECLQRMEKEKTF